MFMFNFCVIKQARSLYLFVYVVNTIDQPFSVNMYEKYASEDDDDKIKLQYTSAPVDDNEKFEI